MELLLRNKLSPKTRTCLKINTQKTVNVSYTWHYFVLLFIYLNPIKFHAPRIFARFILAPLIFAQLNNSYIRARIIFAYWQNLYFRVCLSYDWKFSVKRFETLKVFLALLTLTFKTKIHFQLIFLRYIS